MNKFIVNKFGLVTLTIIFILLYGYMNTFNNSESILGVKDDNALEELGEGRLNTGNSYFLADVKYKEEDSYYRIYIPFKVNQSVFLNNNISSPSTNIQQLAFNEIPDIYKNWVDIENYVLKISLDDTNMAHITDEGSVNEMLETKNIQVRNDVITDIDLISVRDSTTEVLVGLNKKVGYVANNDTSTIFVDILK